MHVMQHAQGPDPGRNVSFTGWLAFNDMVLPSTASSLLSLLPLNKTTCECKCLLQGLFGVAVHHFTQMPQTMAHCWQHLLRFGQGLVPMFVKSRPPYCLNAMHDMGSFISARNCKACMQPVVGVC